MDIYKIVTVRLSFLIKMDASEAGEMKGPFLLSLGIEKNVKHFLPFSKYPSCFSLQDDILIYDIAEKC